MKYTKEITDAIVGEATRQILGKTKSEYERKMYGDQEISQLLKEISTKLEEINNLRERLKLRCRELDAGTHFTTSCYVSNINHHVSSIPCNTNLMVERNNVVPQSNLIKAQLKIDIKNISESSVKETVGILVDQFKG